MLETVKRKRNEAVVELRKSYQVCLGFFLNITVSQKLMCSISFARLVGVKQDFFQAKPGDPNEKIKLFQIILWMTDVRIY